MTATMLFGALGAFFGRSRAEPPAQLGKPISGPGEFRSEHAQSEWNNQNSRTGRNQHDDPDDQDRTAYGGNRDSSREFVCHL